MILAASEGDYEDAEILKVLLENGANLEAKNNHGDTALTLATKKGRTAIVQLLRKELAKLTHQPSPVKEQNQGRGEK